MLKAHYRCSLCELDDVSVRVRERNAGEGIEEYVEHVMSVCGQEHDRRTPWCPTRTLHIDLPITLTEEDKKSLAERLKGPAGAAPRGQDAAG
jgi:hypothetical protein